MAVDVYPIAAADSPVRYRVRVHVPDDRGQHPILYLLHGIGDGEDDWDDVTGHKGRLRAWLPAGFPLYVVTPYCKPRTFPDGQAMPYSAHHFPDAGSFVDYFENGLVESLRNRYPNIAWQRQAIGGISMGGFLAFEIAARRVAANPVWRRPFQCIGLFSPALQACANLPQASNAVAATAPQLLSVAWGDGEHPQTIREIYERLMTILAGRAWLTRDMERGGHNWRVWQPQVHRFLQRIRERL
jgi:hypothetical protein